MQMEKASPGNGLQLFCASGNGTGLFNDILSTLVLLMNWISDICWLQKLSKRLLPNPQKRIFHTNVKNIKSNDCEYCWCANRFFGWRRWRLALHTWLRWGYYLVLTCWNFKTLNMFLCTGCQSGLQQHVYKRVEMKTVASMEKRGSCNRHKIQPFNPEFPKWQVPRF
jgi:hypothetical protein